LAFCKKAVKVLKTNAKPKAVKKGNTVPARKDSKSHISKKHVEAALGLRGLQWTVEDISFVLGFSVSTISRAIRKEFKKKQKGEEDINRAIFLAKEEAERRGLQNLPRVEFDNLLEKVKRGEL
jgi:hypothetical protein